MQNPPLYKPPWTSNELERKYWNKHKTDDSEKDLSDSVNKSKEIEIILEAEGKMPTVKQVESSAENMWTVWLQ